MVPFYVSSSAHYPKHIFWLVNLSCIFASWLDIFSYNRNFGWNVALKKTWGINHIAGPSAIDCCYQRHVVKNKPMIFRVNAFHCSITKKTDDLVICLPRSHLDINSRCFQISNYCELHFSLVVKIKFLEFFTPLVSMIFFSKSLQFCCFCIIYMFLSLRFAAIEDHNTLTICKFQNMINLSKEICNNFIEFEEYLLLKLFWIITLYQFSPRYLT